MKRISVIIVTYKKIDIVKDCLESIKRFNDIGDELEVIISDNSEDDNLVNVIRNEYDWVNVIKNKNEGFGAGNNRGYEISSGKYLLFLNPDTILVEPIFKFTIQKFEEDNNLGLFGVQLINRQGKKNNSFFMLDRYSITAALICRFYRKINHYIDDKMYISGANLFVRRSAFEAAGKFDENIFMYKEEADLIKRIKLRSQFKKTAFFDNVKIIHLEGGTEGGNVLSFTVLSRIYEADKYYVKKWGGEIKKIYKQRRGYIRFKRFVYACLLNRTGIKKCNDVIKFYNNIISNHD